MSKYRVGRYLSAVHGGFAIQKKYWFWWHTTHTFDFLNDVIKCVRELQERGHEVKWYI